MCCKTAQVEVQIKLWRLFEEKYETDPNASLQLLSMLFHTNFNLKCAGLLQKTFVNESTRREWNSVSFESFDRYGFMFCFSANQINLSKQFPEIPKVILFFMRFKFFLLVTESPVWSFKKPVSLSFMRHGITLTACVCAHMSVRACDILLILSFIGSFLFSSSLTISCFHYHPMISLLFNSLISCTIKCSGNLFA